MVDTPEFFKSSVFGDTRQASSQEYELIRIHIDETPVAVFQELNKALNELGFCLSIGRLPAEH